MRKVLAVGICRLQKEIFSKVASLPESVDFGIAKNPKLDGVSEIMIKEGWN